MINVINQQVIEKKTEVSAIKSLVVWLPKQITHQVNQIWALTFLGVCVYTICSLKASSHKLQKAIFLK